MTLYVFQNFIPKVGYVSSVSPASSVNELHPVNVTVDRSSARFHCLINFDLTVSLQIINGVICESVKRVGQTR